MKDSENHDGCFDCNICLDIASDPVVTLCGHLYCWPCIYKWFHVHSASLPSDEYPQCPVCKTEISHTTVIPLYGRGPGPNTASWGTLTPPRPAACGTRALLNAASQPRHQLGSYRNPYQQPYIERFSESEEGETGGAVDNAVQPVVGIFGEMVYARVFGNSQSLYAYHEMGGYGSRLTRQDMQVDKSLSRVSLFLMCCFLLCVLLF